MGNAKRGDANRDAIADRKNDLYETPPAATHALMRMVNLPSKVWEPCCGPGAIVNVIRESGRKCFATDLVDYGCVDSLSGVDFLMEHRAPGGCDTIVTNFPYKLHDACVRHGLSLCSVVICLSRLSYLEGARRSDLIDGHLSKIFVGTERLPMMHRQGWQGAKVKSGAMQFAWFVFTRQRPLQTILERVSWRGGK
jgi:hypothetical protein